MDGIKYLSVEELEKFVAQLKIDIHQKQATVNAGIGDSQYHMRILKEHVELLRIAENELFDKIVLEKS